MLYKSLLTAASILAFARASTSCASSQNGACVSTISDSEAKLMMPSMMDPICAVGNGVVVKEEREGLFVTQPGAFTCIRDKFAEKDAKQFMKLAKKIKAYAKKKGYKTNLAERLDREMLSVSSKNTKHTIAFFNHFHETLKGAFKHEFGEIVSYIKACGKDKKFAFRIVIGADIPETRLVGMPDFKPHGHNAGAPFPGAALQLQVHSGAYHFPTTYFKQLEVTSIQRHSDGYITLTEYDVDRKPSGKRYETRLEAMRDQFAKVVKAFPLCALIKTSLEVPHGASPRRYSNGTPKKLFIQLFERDINA